MWINFTWKLIRDLWIDTTQNPKYLSKLFQVKCCLVTFTWQRCRERRRKRKLSSIPTIANSRWSLTIMIEQGSKSYSYIALAWKRIPTYPFNKRKPLCVPWGFSARRPINFSCILRLGPHKVIITVTNKRCTCAVTSASDSETDAYCTRHIQLLFCFSKYNRWSNSLHLRLTRVFRFDRDYDYVYDVIRTRRISYLEFHTSY